MYTLSMLINQTLLQLQVHFMKKPVFDPINPPLLWNKHANMLNAFMCVLLGCIYQGANQEKISGATLTESMTQFQCMAS